jgi:hypothetical protein
MGPRVNLDEAGEHRRWKLKFRCASVILPLLGKLDTAKCSTDPSSPKPDSTSSRNELTVMATRQTSTAVDPSPHIPGNRGRRSANRVDR